MDEIAAEIGVSQDRTLPLLRRQERPHDRGHDALHADHADPEHGGRACPRVDGLAQTREIIRVYVETVAAEPEPYRFVMANSSASRNKVVADSERVIARMLAVMLRQRMRAVGMDTRGVEPWAYLIVGGVQLATHSWMSNPRMSADELIDYLTMLCWNALCGIVEVGVRGRCSTPSRTLRRVCRHHYCPHRRRSL